MARPLRPAGRDDFQVGVICALSLEARMIEHIFDERFAKDDSFGKAYNDKTTYTTGAIAGHNVALAYCPGMGSVAAAQTASDLKNSFPGIQIVFLVGICGVVPLQKEEEIVLGDCIISTNMIQPDFGRLGPIGSSRKREFDAPGRAAAIVRSLQSKLQTQTLNMMKEVREYLRLLQKEENIVYHGAQQDRLYEAGYDHTHDTCPECDDSLGLCAKECADVGCDDAYLIRRERLQQDTFPRIHFGAFSSSDLVIKSGKHRDNIARTEKVIAFEMEAAGIWDVFPTIIIKAACDYADSHKNKKWQAYASAVAAATLKAVLGVADFSDPLEPAAKIVKLGQTAFRCSNSTELSLSYRDSADAISKADAAIRNYHNVPSRLCVERLSGKKLTLDKCYINLALVDRATMKQQEQSFSRRRLDSATTGRTIPLTDLFNSQKLSDGNHGNPRRIFIQGRAGVGKTTLCKKLVYEFLQNRLGTNLFARLLWIPLRRLKNKQGPYSWQDLLQDAYALQEPGWRQSCQLYTDQLYSKDFLDKTLLLFDGLDEISHGWKEDVFYDFLADIICNSPNVIITSRPQARTFDPGRFDLELETTGFLPEQIDQYIKNCVKQDSVISEMKEFIKSRPPVESLLRIPIQLDAFCCTWPRQKPTGGSLANLQRSAGPGVTLSGVSTMTTLYHAISLELCRKDLSRLQIEACPREMSDFEITQALSNEIRLLGELAFQGIWNKIVEFYPSHCNSIIAHAAKHELQLSIATKHEFQLPTPYSSVLDCLSFIRTSDIEQDPSKRNYHFLHLTFQEFFAAQYFVDHWFHNSKLQCLGLASSVETKSFSPTQFVQLEKYSPHLNIFWRFVTGLIQLQVQDGSRIGLSSEHRNLSAFFTQIEGPPTDLIGFARRRILIHCLSEVIASEDMETQQLRQKLETTIYDNFINEEFLSYPYQNIYYEPEFPEGVLHQLLLSDSRDFDVITAAIMRKPRLGPVLTDFFLAQLTSATTLKERMISAAVTCKVWTGDPEELLLRINPLLRENPDDTQLTVLTNKFINRFWYGFGSDCLWSSEVAKFLFNIFHDKNEQVSVRRKIARLLSYGVPTAYYPIVASIMGDDSEDFDIRDSAFYMLGYRKDLSQDTVRALLPILSRKDTGYRVIVLDMLEAAYALPAEAVCLLYEIFKSKDEGRQTRVKAFSALQKSNLSDGLIQDCISICSDKSDDFFVRLTLMSILAKAALNRMDIDSLLLMVEDEDEEPRMRAEAFSILMKLPVTPRRALQALIKAVKTGSTEAFKISDDSPPLQPLPRELEDFILSVMAGDDHDAQDALLDTSWWLAFTLPKAVIKMLIELMEKKKLIEPDSYWYFLQQPHLSKEDMWRCTSIIMDGGDFGGFTIMLHHRDIYSGMIDPETRLWKNLVTYWLDEENDSDICFYEYEKLLYVWHNGRRYQVTSTPEYSAKLLKIFHDVKSGKLHSQSRHRDARKSRNER